MNTHNLKELKICLMDISNTLAEMKQNTQTKDAKFDFINAEKHLKEHKKRNELPQDLTLQEYMQIAEQTSLKNIDGKTVRAFTYAGGRTGKTDGKWFVSYAGGKSGGTIITCFLLRGGYARFKNLMTESIGKEIFGTKK